VLSFEVENFGKVQRADVELAPFVILIGKNNTGKSYVASLIWALSNLSPLLSSEKAPERPAWFQTFMRAKPDTLPVIEVDEKKRADLIEHVNACFARAGSEFLDEVFAYDGFQRTKVTLRPGGSEDFTLSMQTIESASDKSRTYTSFTYDTSEQNRLLQVRYPRRVGLSGAWTANRIFADLVGIALFGYLWPKYRASNYIPAARTGLMLALRALVSQTFNDDAEQISQQLPRPLTSFLERVAYPVLPSATKQGPGEWLAEQVVHGTIKSDRSEIPSFSYVPSATDMSVPLHAASSMITELAPFLLMAQTRNGLNHVIFEEPEAHLHLEAQRSMARTIARLLSDGAFVTVTTHSDTFVQQINNLMRLHTHPHKKSLMAELGYQPQDTIDPTIVRAYEFAESPDGTVVSKLSMNEEGFVVPTLNETLISLARETFLLSEDYDAEQM
jgi:predicted ATPase